MIYFVTQTFLKDETPITNNVELTDIYPLVKTSADMWVRYAIGTYFYEYLLVKYNAQTLSQNEENLVAIMQYCIAWRTCSEAVLELSYQLKNKGIQTQSGDYSNSPETKAIMLMSKHYAQKADYYDIKLFEYLKENKDLYPQFIDKLNNDSSIKKTCSKPNSGYNFNVFSV